METIMYHAVFRRYIGNPFDAWCTVLRNWSELRKVRKESRRRAELASHLDAHILKDIGIGDCRPSRVAGRNDNPYQLLVEAFVRKDRSEFSSRLLTDL
jgi:uncharacterized protein YjiS (DUF1127 family)